MSLSEFTEKKKRGPGRPPNVNTTPNLKKDGVSSTPKIKENVLEFIYEKPIVFKLIFAYFKASKCSEIKMRFTPTEVTLFTIDHLNSTKIAVYLNGEGVNWYYCAKEFWVIVNLDIFEKMCSSIDKNISEIKIFSKPNLANPSGPREIVFVLLNPNIQNDEMYEINMAEIKTDPNITHFEEEIDTGKIDTNFPLSFSLPSKNFKNIINNISKFSEIFQIEYRYNSPLCFKYNISNINYHSVFKANEKIHLKILEETNITSDLSIDVIRPISNSGLSDSVSIYCKQNGSVLFKSNIDRNTVTINAFININCP